MLLSHVRLHWTLYPPPQKVLYILSPIKYIKTKGTIYLKITIFINSSGQAE